MKLKLSINDVPYSGYLNVDPVPVIEKDKADQYKIEERNFRNLEDIVSAAECSEILAINILDYIHASEMINVIRYIVSKLRHNGILIIGGTDIEVVSKMYLNGEINTFEFNQLVHGTYEDPWSMKQGQMTLEDLEDVILTLGLKMLEKNIDGTHMYIKAQRE